MKAFSRWKDKSFVGLEIDLPNGQLPRTRVVGDGVVEARSDLRERRGPAIGARESESPG